MNKLVSSIIFLSVLLISHTDSSLAQATSSDHPLEIQIENINQNIKSGESTEAIIVLNNNSSHQISTSIEPTSNNYLSIKDKTKTPVTVEPYGSYQETFTVTGGKTGTTELVFIVRYNWTDSISNQENIRTDIIKSSPIEVPGFRFDWPAYFIPLVLGFIFGQLGTWLSSWHNRVEEDQIKQEQTIAITLAALQIGSKGIERHETISFQLWDEMVLKGNLYPYLIRLGKKIKDEKLAHRLTVLTVLISEYNNSREKGDLSEDLVIDLSEEIRQLIQIIEQIN